MEDVFLVHMPNGTQMMFRICGERPCHSDPNKDAVALVNTVAEMQKHCGKRQNQRALMAHDSCHALWFPSLEAHKNDVMAGTTSNC